MANYTNSHDQGQPSSPLNPHESHALDDIGKWLAREDPALASRLGGGHRIAGHKARPRKLAMASYTGPATIVSREGEIEVAIDLRSSTDADGSVTWAGHIDDGDRSALRLAMKTLTCYGMVWRLPDGRKGRFMPSAETTWSIGSISVSGFLRG